MLGLNQPHINFVHGVGISNDHFQELAEKQIGLIWSPFSNLLLYSETLDIAAALKAGVRIALGSDWVPTGSKSPLEEVKLARQYIEKDKDLREYFSVSGKFSESKMDEFLFTTMTENPSQMINHWEISKTEAAIGTLAVGAMGTLIAVKKQDSNPYTNLVLKTTEAEIDLVIIDGKPIYGEIEYLKALGVKNYEAMENEIQEADKILALGVPKPPSEESLESLNAHVVKIGVLAKGLKMGPSQSCLFTHSKALVTQNSMAIEPGLNMIREKTGLNLDRFEDLQKILALNLLTQTRNLNEPDGDPLFAVKSFPSLYSCNNSSHVERVSGFVNASGRDEWTDNLQERASLREKFKLGKVPKTLEQLYPEK